ncbi:Sedlin [Neoconidiobolus thromboides FSU 785]|nr:Sedlin [Neoconidiobolus thromboides FSU 785]
MSYYFAIVGLKDNPIYEAEFGYSTNSNKGEEYKHLNQFIVHGALDIVEDVMWLNKDLYLKTVDKFNDWLISAYVTPSYVKFMLMHGVQNEDSIRSFFIEVHELYLKVLLNPFYDVNNKINSKEFDLKVRAVAKRYL